METVSTSGNFCRMVHEIDPVDYWKIQLFLVKDLNTAYIIYIYIYIHINLFKPFLQVEVGPVLVNRPDLGTMFKCGRRHICVMMVKSLRKKVNVQIVSMPGALDLSCFQG